MQILELTGDNRKEVIISWGVYLYFSCQDGQWYIDR